MIQVLKVVITMFWYDVYPQVNELQFSHWVEDVLAVVENLTDGPIVLVNLTDRPIGRVRPQMGPKSG